MRRDREGSIVRFYLFWYGLILVFFFFLLGHMILALNKRLGLNLIKLWVEYSFLGYKFLCSLV